MSETVSGHAEHRYIYKINFECNAEDISQADRMFMEHCRLFYQPDPKKPQRFLLGWMSPLISVEIVRDPQLRLNGATEGL